MELLDMTNLSELSNIADPLALQGAEVLGDSAALEVDNTGEGLVEQGANRGNGEVAGFGLEVFRQLLLYRNARMVTHSKGVNHGLVAHVDLATADDLSDIGGVIGLQKSNLEAFFLEVTLGVSQIQGGVVWRRVPLCT